MATNTTTKGLDTGTKVIIGIASLALILAFVGGDPDNDAWQTDDDTSGADSAATSSGDQSTVDLDLDEDDDVTAATDDPWTRGAPSGSTDGDDDESEPPVDDPWTRGAPSGSTDGDDESEPPVDDPWTRGSDADGGFGDDGLPACIGVSDFETDVGSVPLPIDSTDDAFASPDCQIAPGGSGNAVWLVQVALNACNGQSVQIDSVNGAATTQALAAVQAQNGLTADGVYGPATREVMAWPTVPDDDAGGAQCVAHPSVE